MKSPTTYLDYAAATPIDKSVLEAMQPYFSNTFYNPSATYLSANSVLKDLEAARSKVAYWLGARPSEIIFTAGATEANNLAIHGIMRKYPEGNIVVSGIEHESVLAPAKRYDFREAKVGPDGRIDVSDLEKLIDANTVLVSVMYANNEIGTIEPLHEVLKVITAKRKERVSSSLPLFFHSDAAQAANYLDLHVSRLGVDLLSLNGGKIYGPKQSGALYVKAGITIEPLIDGGGQERGIRSGTENVAGNVGFAVALDLVQNSRHDEIKRLSELQKHFIELLSKKVPKAEINGSLKNRLPNNIHLTIAGADNERLLMELDEAGIAAAAGSACSASDEEPSHVLRAIGKSDAEARASLRFTLGRSTSVKDVEKAVTELTKLT